MHAKEVPVEEAACIATMAKPDESAQEENFTKLDAMVEEVSPSLEWCDHNAINKENVFYSFTGCAT